jgi:hypothetical protein
MVELTCFAVLGKIYPKRLKRICQNCNFTVIFVMYMMIRFSIMSILESFENQSSDKQAFWAKFA